MCKRQDPSYLGKLRAKNSKMHMIYDWGLAPRDAKGAGVPDCARREMAAVLYQVGPQAL